MAEFTYTLCQVSGFHETSAGQAMCRRKASSLGSVPSGNLANLLPKPRRWLKTMRALGLKLTHLNISKQGELTLHYCGCGCHSE